jgi:putative transcriptional regulator
MRNNIDEAVASTVKDMMDMGLKVSFTQKELSKMGIEMPYVSLDAAQIRDIRQKLKISQAVFAKLLNVSLSSVRQWEQGLRKPSGSTMVLLELLDREPHLLDYRLGLGAA